MKKCLKCGKVIPKEKTNKWYCSNACFKTHTRIMEKICPKCGIKFKTTASHKYCEECAYKIKTEYKIYNFKIFQRDRFICVYCGKSSIEDGIKLSVEHIFPRCAYDNHHPYALVTSCVECNMKKGVNSLPKDVIKRIIKRNKHLMRNMPPEEILKMEKFFWGHYNSDLSETQFESKERETNFKKQ